VTNDGLLFDVRPIEDEDGKKKKPRAKRAAMAASPVAHKSEPEEFTYGYMASIEDHIQCDQCGLMIVDLVEIKRVGKIEQWLVKCGWWCQTEWWVDPIPGILDKNEQNEKQFRVIGGLFDGKTFDEIRDEGCRWYIEAQVERGTRSLLAEEAAKWLLNNP
jgi:hypothetical protein